MRLSQLLPDRLIAYWRRVTAFTHHPIATAEYIFQAQTTAQGNAWTRSLLLVGTGLHFVSAMIYLLTFFPEFSAELVSRWLFVAPAQMQEFLTTGLFYSVVGLGLLTSVIFYQATARAAFQGANVIAREKNSETWEMLLLTGVDTPSLVLGKWWGTAAYVMRKYRLHLGLRVVYLLWLVLVIDRLGLAVEAYPRAHNVALAILVLVVGWVLLVIQISAHGVMGSHLGGRELGRGRLVSQCSQGCIIFPLRFVLVLALVIAGIVYIDPTIFTSPTITPAQERVLLLAFMLFPYDVGSILAICLITPSSYHQQNTGLFLLGAVAGFGLEVIFLWLNLRAARFFAVKQRVSAPDKPSKAQPDRPASH